MCSHVIRLIQAKADTKRGSMIFHESFRVLLFLLKMVNIGLSVEFYNFQPTDRVCLNCFETATKKNPQASLRISYWGRNLNWGCKLELVEHSYYYLTDLALLLLLSIYILPLPAQLVFQFQPNCQPTIREGHINFVFSSPYLIGYYHQLIYD